ncbi:MAG: S8 family serine peptidase [Verrucomicrobiota bacterium]
MRRKVSQTIILFLALCFAIHVRAAAPPVVWHAKEKTFDADVSGVELRELLKKISTLTGWQVYVEPGSSYVATAKFKSLPRSEALRLLLGELSFEISPQSNSVPKLFVFRTGANRATQLVAVEKRALILGKNKIILNHLVVSLKSGSTLDIEALAQQLGGKVIGKIGGMNSYLLEFADEQSTSAAREKISQAEGIASLDSDYLVDRPSPVKSALTDGARGNSPFTLKPGVGSGDGKQIMIGLIDTAVQDLPENMRGFMLPGISLVGDSVPGAEMTHGTAMAESILMGMNSTAASGPLSVVIQPWNVYPNDPEHPGTTTFYLANGIVQAANGGANIISISSGSYGDSTLLENVVRQVSEKGIPIIAAAGNEPVTTAVYPAAYPGVLAVTSAQDQNGTIASYANRGDFVDLILPGSSLVSYQEQRFLVNGTSVSTAFASGMMAGLAASTQQAPAKILPTLTRSFGFKH